MSSKTLFLTGWWILCGVFIALLSIHVLHINAYVYDLEGVEQDEVFTLQRVLAGYPVYENPQEPPFAVTQKTPMYHYLCACLGHLFGVDPQEPHQVYQLNRSVSLGLSLGLLLLAFFIQTRLFAYTRMAASGICFLIFLCAEMHLFARPDSLFSFLFLAAIGTMMVYLKTGGQPRYLWLAVGLSALAIFSKQTAIVLPPLVLGYVLLIERRFGRFIQGALLFIVLFGLLFWLLSAGKPSVFIANVVGGVRNGIDLGWFFEYIYNASYKKFGLLLILGLLIIRSWWDIKGTDPLKSFIAFFLLFDLIYTHLIALKWGSTPSYFTEFVNITLIAAPLYFREWLEKEAQPRANRLEWLVFLLMLSLIPVHTSEKGLMAPIFSQQPEAFAECEQLSAHVKSKYELQPGTWVLSDDELLKLFLFENALLPQDDILYSIYLYGDYDNSRYVALMQSGQVPLVISRHPLKELEANEFYMCDDLSAYRPLEEVAGFVIYGLGD
ncbi:MAG TPA: hypothetical protein PKA00_12685 [Saprospiraceae bacterium]|nr:hypothetical protein [Saprospiraceae bacterium]HMQ83764.1 hypothetical protein [Saprospiraceae bacterium]